MAVMKRADNLLDSAGLNWFRRRVSGGYMVHKGEVVIVGDVVGGGRVIVHPLDGRNAGFAIDKKLITGFSVFQYPPLGYRRLNDTMVAFLERKHDYMRGLRRRSVTTYLSGCSLLLAEQHPELRMGEDNRVMNAVFLPEYDKPELMADMIAGKRMNMVLNHNVMIEPSALAKGDDDFVLYFRRRVAGRMSTHGKFKWVTDEYRSAIVPLLGEFGAQA